MGERPSRPHARRRKPRPNAIAVPQQNQFFRQAVGKKRSRRPLRDP